MSMGFQYFLAALKKAIDFTGRASMAEYWYFTLFYYLVLFGSALFIELLGDNILGDSLGWAFFIYLLVAIIASLSVLARRIHDTDRSAWHILWLVVPIIGPIWILVLTLSQGDEKKNKYGLPPTAPNHPDKPQTLKK